MNTNELQKAALAMTDVPLSDEEKKRLADDYYKKHPLYFRYQHVLTHRNPLDDLHSFLLSHCPPSSPAAGAVPPEEKQSVAAEPAQPDTASSEKAAPEHTPVDSGKPPTVPEPADPAPAPQDPRKARKLSNRTSYLVHRTWIAPTLAAGAAGMSAEDLQKAALAMNDIPLSDEEKIRLTQEFPSHYRPSFPYSIPDSDQEVKNKLHSFLRSHCPPSTPAASAAPPEVKQSVAAEPAQPDTAPSENASPDHTPTAPVAPSAVPEPAAPNAPASVPPVSVAAEPAQPDTTSSEKTETEHSPVDSGKPSTVPEPAAPNAPASVPPVSVAKDAAQPAPVLPKNASPEHTPTAPVAPSAVPEPATPAPAPQDPRKARELSNRTSYFVHRTCFAPAPVHGEAVPESDPSAKPGTRKKRKRVSSVNVRRSLSCITSPVESRMQDARHDLADLGRARLLSKFCGAQLNGGRIANARNWSAEEWKMHVALPDPISEDCPGLWHFEGDDLIVDDYDASYEAEVLSTRLKNQVKGKNGAASRWGNPPASVCGMAPAMPPVMAPAMPPVSDSSLSPDNEDLEHTFSLPEVHASSPAPPSTPDFIEWLRYLCEAVPQLRECRQLPGEVISAAYCAYERVPHAFEYSSLLKDYYENDITSDFNHAPFLRPSGADFFRNLEDVISLQALRWAELVNWSPPRHPYTSTVMSKMQRMVLLTRAANASLNAGEFSNFLGCIKALDKVDSTYRPNTDKYDKSTIFNSLSEYREKVGVPLKDKIADKT